MNLSERAGEFGRFNVAWTPTIVILSPRGVEQYRIEGYLPREQFRAELEMALARVAFMGKKFADSEKRYEQIMAAHPDRAAEAMYWRAVSIYSGSHDAAPLAEVAKELPAKHPDSLWAVRTRPWAA